MKLVHPQLKFRRKETRRVRRSLLLDPDETSSCNGGQIKVRRLITTVNEAENKESRLVYGPVQRKSSSFRLYGLSH